MYFLNTVIINVVIVVVITKCIKNIKYDIVNEMHISMCIKYIILK